MASYCLAEDVRVLCGLTTAFSDSPATRPTLTQINSIIADVTNEIDLYLSIIGITAQPTDARILGKLKNVCKFGVACHAGLGYLNMSASVNDTKPKTFCDFYKETLQEILDHPEIYGIIADTTSVDCGYNTDHTEDETEGRFIQQDWKS